MLNTPELGLRLSAAISAAIRGELEPVMLGGRELSVLRPADVEALEKLTMNARGETEISKEVRGCCAPQRVLEDVVRLLLGRSDADGRALFSCT